MQGHYLSLPQIRQTKKQRPQRIRKQKLLYWTQCPLEQQT